MNILTHKQLEAIIICIIASFLSINSFSQSACTDTTLTSSSGTFNDGSDNSAYSNNLNCSWLIKPIGASIINIKFDSLATELGHDSIIIYDGQDSLAPVLGSFSGSVIPSSNIISSDTAVFIKFITNGSISDKGFQISYNGIAGCSGRTVLIDPIGIFTDGTKASEAYKNQTTCEWLINPPEAQSVLLNFTRFSTESEFDLVEVFDGNSTGSPLLGTFSGSNLPPQLLAESGRMLIRFTSDISVQRFGWEASYTSSKGHCIQGIELVENTGVFRDGSDTNNYDNNLNCSWLINPNSSDSLTLTFDAFNTELNKDFVNIYDGTSSNDSLLASYSGDTIPPSITAQSGKMFIEFVTNDSITSFGWEASYSNIPGTGGGCSGTKVLSDSSGTFTDGSGNADYENNLSCGWLIDPPGNPAGIELTFDSMNTSNFWDFVRIYDGSNNTGTFLGFLNLGNKGPTFIALSGKMYIEFFTDGSGTADGWKATYTTLDSIDTTSCKPQIFKDDNGAFNDGSGPFANYKNDQYCTYLIQPSTPNRSINVTIFNFNTELGVDTLTVYDGPSESSPILQTISGVPVGFVNLSSTGGSMFMTFKTNDTITSGGWNVSYNTVFNPSCSGNTTLTDLSGTFNDGSTDSLVYSENNNCTWLIDPPGASKISLNFNRFNTENFNDIVRVYDGSNAGTPLIGQFSGRIIPKNIISSGGSLFITFTSNNTVNQLGWEATYTSTADQCFFDHNILTASRDTISDGSDTSNYNNGLNCSWLIQPVNASSISLDFIDFDLDPSDTLKVFNGIDSDGILLGAYTGTSLPPILDVKSTSIFLEFITDSFTTSKGWKIFYNSSSILSCSGIISLTSPSGTFSDGSGIGNDYDNDLHCGWLIQPANVTTIELSLDSADLASGEVVNVYSGPDNLSPLIRRYTGPSSLTAISRTGIMFVEFISNNTTTAKGWTASYITSNSFCLPNNLITAPSATFNDGSGSEKYKNNTDCEWLIQPSTPNVFISLRFLSMQTQLNKDSVILYDGTTTNDSVLAVFTGRKSAAYLNSNRVTSTGGNMLVRFISDSTGTDNGWSANYVTIQAPFCNSKTTFTDSSGTFNDGSPDGTNYAANSNCSWSIEPAHATSIDLTFNYFDTQAGSDSLRIYNGNSASSPLLGTFSGNTLPSKVTANSGKMFLEFKTNVIFHLNGWEAKYSATIPKVLSIVEDTIYINDSVNSSNSFEVSSSISWKANTNETWLSLVPDSSSGDTSVIATTLLPNTAILPRYAKVYVDAVGDTLTDTVIVAQKGIDHLFMDLDTLFINNQVNATASYDVTSNIKWVTGENATWFSQAPDTGDGIDIVTVTALQTNTTFVTRFAKAFVDGIGNALTDTIIIAQRGLNQLLLNKDTIFIDNQVNALDSFDVTSNTKWVTGADVNWFGLSPDTAVNSKTVTVTALQVNSGLDIRFGKAFVDVLNDTLTDTVVIAQRPFDQLDITQDTVFVDNQVNATVPYDVVANIKWVTGENATWFSQAPDTGDGIDIVTVTALQTNTTFVTRFAKAFVDGIGNALTDTIIIAQRGLNQLLLNKDTIFIDNQVNALDSFDVTSNTKWFTGADVNWFGLSPDTAVNSKTVTVTALQVNSGLDIRFGKAFVDVLNDTLTDTVVIAQRPFDQVDITQDTVFVDNQVNATVPYDVVANIKWVTGENATWFSQAPDTGDGIDIVTVTALQTNTTFVTRFAKAFVDGIGNALTDTIIIAQRGLNQLLLNKDTIFIDNQVNALDSFDVTSNTKWFTGADVNWFGLSPDTAVNSKTVTVTALQVNSGLDIRFGKAFVDVLNDTLTDTVVIAQRPFDQVDITQDTVFVDNQVNATVPYDVVANIKWVTGENATWFSQAPDTGDGIDLVTVTALQTNTTFVTRFAKAFVDGIGNALTDTIIIAQRGLNQLLLNKDTIFIDNQVNALDSFDVTSNTKWFTGADVNWFGLSPDTAVNSKTVTVTALQVNSGLDIRFGKAFVDVLNDTLTDTVVIAQRPFDQVDITQDTVFVDNQVNATVPYDVVANIKWVTGENATWFSQAPDTGDGIDIVTVTALQVNSGLNIRYAKAYVDGIGNALTDTIIIAQRPFDQVDITQDTVFVDNQVNATVPYDVVANIKWVTGENATWFSQAPDTGDGIDIVTVTALQTNTTFVTRFAKAFVDGVGNALTDTVIIAQRGLNQLLLNKDTIFIDNQVNALDSFDVTSNTKWFTGADVNWFGLSPDTAVNSKTVTVTALQVNSGLDIRFGKAFVDVLNDTLTDTVVIAQRPFDQVDITQDTVFVDNQVNATVPYDVVANIKWVTGENATWFSQAPDTGDGIDIVTVTALQTNTTFVTRFAKAFVDGVGNALMDTIIIAQRGLNHISIVEDTLYLDDTISSSGVYHILSNADWIGGQTATWFSQEPNVGNGDFIISVTALENNPGEDDRFAKAFVDVVNDTISDTIIIAQRG